MSQPIDERYFLSNFVFTVFFQLVWSLFNSLFLMLVRRKVEFATCVHQFNLPHPMSTVRLNCQSISQNNSGSNGISGNKKD